MATENLKCSKCGYIFENDTEKAYGTCPLCGNEYKVEEALELFNKLDRDNTVIKQKPKSKGKIIAEWIMFFASFSAFIIILHYIISYIVGA